MSNSDVFGSPMVLTGKKPVSPFGAAPYTTLRQSMTAKARRMLVENLQRFLKPNQRQQRVRKTVTELSKLDDYRLRDLGLDRTAIAGAALSRDAGLCRSHWKFPM